MDMMAKSLKLRILALILLISVVPLCLVGYIGYKSAGDALKKQYFNSFQAIAEGREATVIDSLRAKLSKVMGFGSDLYIRETLTKLEEKGPDSVALSEKLSDYLANDKKPTDSDIQEIIIMDAKGIVVASSEKKTIGQDKAGDALFINGKLGPFIKDVYISEATSGMHSIAFSDPIKSKETGALLGVIANRYNASLLTDLVSDRTGLGETGEVYIINKDNYIITDSRFVKDVFLKQIVDTEPVKAYRSQNKNTSGIYTDYRNNKVVGAVMGVVLKENANLGWLILTEIDFQEAFAPVHKLRNLIFAVILCAVIIVAFLVIIIAGGIANPIKKLADTAGEVARGNLTVSAESKSKDEIGQLAGSFNYMIKNLNNILGKTQDSVNRISSATSEILAASQQQAAGAREQSAAVSETTSASKELSKSAEQVGENIKRVSESTVRTMAGMIKIKDSITKTNQIIASLSEKSQKIGKIAEVIDDVADRTNLLAVNAAIEAARAGEEGRGFTVVADEIRKLADSTAKSTKDITALIEVIQHEMSNVAISMEDSVSSVNEESGRAEESAEISKEIAMSTAQQISGSKQISEAMVNIDEVMKQIATGAQQSQTAAKQLSETGKELKELAEKFRIAKA